MAALCTTDDDEKVAVVAADRMVTLGGFIEFEHAIPKMAHPSRRAIAMIAGDTLVGTRLAQNVAVALGGTTPRVVDIANALATHYDEVRRQALEAALLTPRALSLQAFYANHASFNGQITMMIDQQMQQFNLGVELLLAGADDDGAHIYSVHNPGGTEIQHDVIGYAAIGSGAIHALQSMIGFGHHSGAPLKETVFRVYASKRRSEVAPGVGHDTDMAIVGNGGSEWLSEEQLNQLATVYETFDDSTRAALTDELNGLDLDAPEGVGDAGTDPVL